MATEDATRLKNQSSVFKLSALTGDAEYQLQGQMLVGREMDCEIVLDFGHISRYHAKVNVSPGGVYIEDLQSTNGTFVNGNKIRGRVRLNPGDEVAFDDLAFRLEARHQDGGNPSAVGSGTELRPRAVKPMASIEPIARHFKKPKLNESMVETREEPAVPPMSAQRDPEPELEPPKASGRASRAPRAAPPPVEPEDDEASIESTQMLSTETLERLISRSYADQPILDLGDGPRLIVTTAPLRGKVFEFDDLQNEWRVGRDSGADVCLVDGTVSLDHALITRTEKGYRASATHAANTLLINGRECTNSALRHDDKLQVGRMELVFRTNYPQEERQARELAQASAKRRVRLMSWSLALLMLGCLAALFFAEQLGVPLPFSLDFSSLFS